MISRVSPTIPKPVKIVQTEIVKKTLDPVWKPVSAVVKDLTGGDLENGQILFECLDDDVGSDELIGTFTVGFDSSAYRIFAH